jgi:hypothetical protein
MIAGAVKWGGTPSAINGVQRFSITHTNNLVLDTARSVEDRFQQMPYVGQKLYTFEFDILMAQAVASSIVDHFYGKANQPEDGATAINPTSGVEFKIEVVNGARNGIIWLDECNIDDITKQMNVGGGLVILGVRGTSRGAKSSTPFQWWS